EPGSVVVNLSRNWPARIRVGFHPDLDLAVNLHHLGLHRGGHASGEAHLEGGVGLSDQEVEHGLVNAVIQRNKRLDQANGAALKIHIRRKPDHRTAVSAMRLLGHNPNSLTELNAVAPLAIPKGGLARDLA